MSDSKSTEPSPQSQQTRNECFLCGRKESGAWHYAATLGRFVCDACFRRAMSAPETPHGRR